MFVRRSALFASVACPKCLRVFLNTILQGRMLFVFTHDWQIRRDWDWECFINAIIRQLGISLSMYFLHVLVGSSRHCPFFAIR